MAEVTVLRDQSVSIINDRGPVRIVTGGQGPAGIDGGDRWEIGNWDTDRPASGEEVVSWILTTEVVLPANLLASRAKARVASTGTAVYSIRKNDVEIGTITFTASVDGVFAFVSSVTFIAGDRISIVAPNPRDATLSGVVITIVGSR